jgi:hypothetical protein
MVLRREALKASGWVQEPLLADRVGERVISGGDVEMVARIAGQGWEIWYAPECRLRHLIPATRATRRGVLSLVHGLGACSAHHDALWWTGRRLSFLRGVGRGHFPGPLDIGRSMAAALVHRRDPAGPVFDAAFLLGRLRGALAVALAPPDRRRKLFGAARRGRPASAPPG